MIQINYKNKLSLIIPAMLLIADFHLRNQGAPSPQPQQAGVQNGAGANAGRTGTNVRNGWVNCLYPGNGFPENQLREFE